MTPLVDIFDQLEAPNSDEFAGVTLTVESLRKNNSIRIGRTIEGCPAILFKVDPGNASLEPVPLENIRLDYDRAVRVTNSAGETTEEHCTVVQCLSRQRDHQTSFLSALDGFLPFLPATISNNDIFKIVINLKKLFEDSGNKRNASGLWAECFVITESLDPLLLLRAWHLTSRDLYDFRWEQSCIEIKATKSNIRSHHFSLEQAHPPNNEVVWVASIFLCEDTNGVSLSILYKELIGIADGHLDLQLKVERVFLETLGTKSENSLKLAFDPILAKEEMAFYTLESIPKVENNQPDEVTFVKFKSDLTFAEKLHDPGDTCPELLRAALRQ